MDITIKNATKEQLMHILNLDGVSITIETPKQDESEYVIEEECIFQIEENDYYIKVHHRKISNLPGSKVIEYIILRGREHFNDTVAMNVFKIIDPLDKFVTCDIRKDVISRGIVNKKDFKIIYNECKNIILDKISNYRIEEVL